MHALTALALLRFITLPAGQDTRVSITLLDNDPTVLIASAVGLPSNSTHVRCQLTDGQDWAMDGTVSEDGVQCTIKITSETKRQLFWVITNADDKTRTISIEIK